MRTVAPKIAPGAAPLTPGERLGHFFDSSGLGRGTDLGSSRAAYPGCHDDFHES